MFTFRFPTKNLSRRHKWLEALKHLGIEPNASSRICNEHFLESDFEVRSSTCPVRLKESAVPSQNLSKSKIMAPRPILPKPPQLVKKEPETFIIPKQETITNLSNKTPYIIMTNNDRKVVCVKDVISLNQNLKKNSKLPLVGGLTVLKQSTPIIQSVSSLNPIVQKKVTRVPMLVKTVKTENSNVNENFKKTEVISPLPLVMKKEVIEKESVSIQVNVPSDREAQLKKKIKVLNQKVRRQNKKISCLKELLYALKKKGLLEPDASEMIDHYFDDSE